MFGRLRGMLSRVDAAYADIRYEIKRETIISFNRRESTHNSSSADGYVVRILKRGGLAAVSFTREADAEKAVRTAEQNAILISEHLREPMELATTGVIRATFFPELAEDPRKVGLDEKLELAGKYNAISMSNERILATNIQYSEIVREKYFLSTEGTELREDLVTTKLGGTVTSCDGNCRQSVRVGAGSSTGFAPLRDQEVEFERKMRLAIELLDAEPVSGGNYDVILNPELAGVFAHEAFGHFSEADLIEDSPTMRGRMRIGSRFGSDILNITDDPTMSGQLGFYKYDDEGVPARPVRLIKEGILAGRLHSRRTAAAFGEPLTGHCVAEDYRFAPIVRMGNIFIEPGTRTFEDLLSTLGDGLYLVDACGGQTSGENFTFAAKFGYIVKGGRLCKLLRDINISGNLYRTLLNIEAIGNDCILTKTGGCGKGQFNPRSCCGGPHMLIREMVIGGR